MENLFECKAIDPMLIGASSAPFDNDAYLYELKFDGERCLAFLDADSTDLRNKRHAEMLSKVPELAEIHTCVNARCVLDGELIVIREGKPSFEAIQRRSLMTNLLKISLLSEQQPATFVAFDILYYQDYDTLVMPLAERKELLFDVIDRETPRFALSRVFSQGVALFEAAKTQGLEGVVAKRKESWYHLGKRTKEWIKFKVLGDDDYIVCGYVKKQDGMTSIVLGQYRDSELVYKGHVTLGVTTPTMRKIRALPTAAQPPFIETLPPGNEDVTWVAPTLVCAVTYMYKSATGAMRQAVLKGLRSDKAPEECVEKT